MKQFLQSSIGKKLLMSLTGLFLISFLSVHLGINLLLIFDDTGALFNKGAYFMETNPVIKIMEPVLAIGFIIHIIYSVILTLQNQWARPEKYAITSQSKNSNWTSRNMFVLGSFIFIFLIIHLTNFYWKMKFTGDNLLAATNVDGVEMRNAYALVSSLFVRFWWYNLIYIVWAIVLGLHLQHAFWSALQTLGLSNRLWLRRWQILANIIAVLFATGFSVIPIYFWMKF